MSCCPEDQPTARLVSRAQSGDQVAFEHLVRRYRPRIFALALHLTGTQSDADDITQDVFLRAYRALDRFEGRSQFFTWIYRMAVNLSLNMHRDRKRRRQIRLHDPRIERALAIDSAPNPAHMAELGRQYRRLLAALDDLPPAMRATVVLVSLQGLSYKEAAAVQGCPVGTVAWHVHQARRRLREALYSDVDAQGSQANNGVRATGTFGPF